MIDVARAAPAARADRLARRRRRLAPVPRRRLRRRAVPDGPDVHGGPRRRGRRDAARARRRWARRRQHPGPIQPLFALMEQAIVDHISAGARRLRARGVLHARPRRRRLAAARRRPRRRHRRSVDGDVAPAVHPPSSCGSTSTSRRWVRSSPRRPTTRSRRWSVRWSSRGSPSSSTAGCRSASRWWSRPDARRPRSVRPVSLPSRRGAPS